MMTRSVRLLMATLLAVGLVAMHPHLTLAETPVSDCPTTETDLISDISKAGSGGTVAFNCSVATQIPFDSGRGGTGSPITIQQSVTLDASSSPGTVTLDGGGSVRLFSVGGGNLTFTLNSLTLSHGHSSVGAGAIENDAGTVRIINSRLTGNTVSGEGGVISNNSSLIITGSTFSGNSATNGGAIANEEVVYITNSTFSGNTASGDGGAIRNISTGIIITNSTFFGNSATGRGGAIANTAGLTLTDSTFSGNSASSGGAIYNDAVGFVHIGGSILAASSNGTNCVNQGYFSNAVGDNGHNLTDSNGDCGLHNGTTDITGKDPLLDPLASNGGPTETMALRPGSPAIDANSCSFTYLDTSTLITTDQRGYPRPDNGESSCDIGAYEFQNDTTTTLSSSANPSVYGQSVTFTATITAPAGATPPPTGTVDFFDGGTKIGSGTVSTSSGGVTTATFTTSSLSVGTHTITATYNGDTTFQGSTAQAISQSVAMAGTSTKVTSSTAPTVYGQAVTFTATVTVASPGVGTPTGSVQFAIDGTNLGSPVALNGGGQAVISTSTFSVGTHTITATYSGNAGFSSSGGSTSQTVTKAATSTAVTSSLNPSHVGQTLTFTAAVSALPPGSGAPSGWVSFSYQNNGTTVVAFAPLVTGVARFSTSSLSAGTHSVTATYTGSTQYATSTSSPLSQQVS